MGCPFNPNDKIGFLATSFTRACFFTPPQLPTRTPKDIVEQDCRMSNITISRIHLSLSCSKCQEAFTWDNWNTSRGWPLVLLHSALFLLLLLPLNVLQNPEVFASCDLLLLFFRTNIWTSGNRKDPTRNLNVNEPVCPFGFFWQPHCSDQSDPHPQEVHQSTCQGWKHQRRSLSWPLGRKYFLLHVCSVSFSALDCYSRTKYDASQCINEYKAFHACAKKAKNVLILCFFLSPFSPFRAIYYKPILVASITFDFLRTSSADFDTGAVWLRCKTSSSPDYERNGELAFPLVILPSS